MSKKKRRTKYDILCDEGLKDDTLNLMRGLTSQGISREMVARQLDISVETLSSWCNKYPEVKEALRKGSAYLYADSANILIDMMHDKSLSPELRASIASKFLSYEKQRWDAILQKERDNGEDKGVTLIFKR